MSDFLDLLGEVHFEELPGNPGKVRCVETGHELPSTQKEGYSKSKKCRRALFDLCLAQRKPPLNVFKQSPNFEDKVLCKLTGDLLNKSEEAVWKHMNGKKFLRKLSQKEDEKKGHVQGDTADLMDVSRQTGYIEHAGTESTKSTNACSMDKDTDEHMNIDEPDFWFPSDGDQGSESSDDMPPPVEDQRYENTKRSIEAFTGTKRKLTKGGHNQKGALKKKVRSDGMSQWFR